MKSIIHADAVAAALCGTQRIADDAPLRKSRFCVTLPCDEGTLLYHTLTGELLLLGGGESMEENRQALAAAWFLVPKGWDELRHAKQIRAILAAYAMQGKEKTAFVILPTTDCNARCFYCFERGVKPLSMTAETARAVAEYIAGSCGEKPVSIHWFGGEPLVNAAAIDVICAVLRERGVEFVSRMTSNGYLLDPETSLRARRDWNLEQVQITLDGTAQVYRRIKAYRDEEPDPLHRVLQNIDGALDAGIRVIARLNMDAGNADDLFCLADELGARFQGRHGMKAIVILLKEVAGKIRHFTSDQEGIERREALEQKLKEYGFTLEQSALEGKIVVNKCIADNDGGEVILPDGGITKCEHVNCSAPIGTVFDAERDKEEIRAWKEQVSFAECAECALFPRCIVLKRCEWFRDGCSTSFRYFALRSLKKQIFEAYEKTKGKEELG